jgi:hypothetical protein
MLKLKHRLCKVQLLDDLTPSTKAARITGDASDPRGSVLRITGKEIGEPSCYKNSQNIASCFRAGNRLHDVVYAYYS